MEPAQSTPVRVLEALSDLAKGRDSDEESTRLAFLEILDGGVPDALLAAYLTGLRFVGDRPAVLAGAVGAVRSKMVGFEPHARPVLDTCGTGGDHAKTVNVSTGAAIVAAACGVLVAKHGNRSATGNSGSSDVLQTLGAPVEVSAEQARGNLEELGLTFLFAPLYHPALRLVAPVRRMLPFRTVFNLVGPLVNPARPEYQLVGVPDRATASLMANVLAASGLKRAAVVSAEDGLDEVSLGATTHVLWVENGEISETEWKPGDFGDARVEAGELRVEGPEESARLIRGVLAGERGPVRDVIVANAAAALHVAGMAGDLAEGVELAGSSIDSGRARALLDRWIEQGR